MVEGNQRQHVHIIVCVCVCVCVCAWAMYAYMYHYVLGTSQNAYSLDNPKQTRFSILNNSLGRLFIAIRWWVFVNIAILQLEHSGELLFTSFQK